ncbi:hypothetical protein Mp_2g19590 [Marchantia polymorpha subsp. ruderalis]|uniref:Uncharacterized protein n=1 Tax=Marchantia polymorpha TaxID=3197 RepID=A0A2R6WVE9_MARPO|nr:hypothetical protein MARPO_0055s0092 [Marchantia polymorpha]BBN02955.1 hypothetical protein Mp_2g19590 [Marchantia polymorpha subsp. ruderalis]|eukprot:PTQ37835.1 hypothetical protein MARPO_0055s0092 [Marchantia polymorpha]
MLTKRTISEQRRQKDGNVSMRIEESKTITEHSDSPHYLLPSSGQSHYSSGQLGMIYINEYIYIYLLRIQ